MADKTMKTQPFLKMLSVFRGSSLSRSGYATQSVCQSGFSKTRKKGWLGEDSNQDSQKSPYYIH